MQRTAQTQVSKTRLREQVKINRVATLGHPVMLIVEGERSVVVR